MINRRNAAASTGMIAAVVSLILVVGLAWLLMNPPQKRASQDGAGSGAGSSNGLERSGGDRSSDAGGSSGAASSNGAEHKSPNGTSLYVYCAAGIAKPVEAAAKSFEQEYGVQVQLNYAGSGALLTGLQVQKKGDLFLAADTSYIELAREKHLLDEAIPLAKQYPVIAVRKGNPKNIQSIQDLVRDDVRTALTNPEAASIGKLTQQLLEKTGEWESVSQAADVTKPTVNDVATDVVIGAVDAAIVWDAIVRQRPADLEMVRLPVFDEAVMDVTIGVLKTCEQPALALRFARYLQAPEKGQREFTRFGFETVEGDAWAERPALLLYSGGVIRLALQDTVRQFELREGVEVDVQYNGCGGGFVTLIKGSQQQQVDAYFACDVSFMTIVEDKFLPPRTVSQTDMILIVHKGNPREIGSIRDLAREGLQVGLANPDQTALGALTKKLFETISVGDDNLYAAIEKQGNMKVNSPTADYLVTQLVHGGLDAVVVYQANVPNVLDEIEVIPITDGNPTAVQPIAINKESSHKYLTQRLIDAILSDESQQRFLSVGFGWRGGAEGP